MSSDFNDDFNKTRQGKVTKAPAKTKAATPGKINEKEVGWGGLPGKAQSKSRSGGVEKAKVYPSSEGL